MEWRCEWCEKPHEENDPPCDNCGHGTFEKAVVQQAPQSEGPDETTLWVCTECGRAHPRHTPPCSRCGNANLQREVRSVTDEELTAPSYFDLLTPRYALGLVLALGLGVVFLLGATGVVDVPGFGNDVPEVSNVPGNATSDAGIALADVEYEYVKALNQRRAQAGNDPLSVSDRLDEVATFYNQRRVKAALGEGSVPSDDRLRKLASPACDGPVTGVGFTAQPGSEASTPGDVAESLLAVDNQGTASGTTIVGVDVHAVDDRLFVVRLVCQN
ncbi:hypothetical protein ACKVMT_05895 [Halobacteriales archaeon Cl-PHB]